MSTTRRHPQIHQAAPDGPCDLGVLSCHDHQSRQGTQDVHELLQSEPAFGHRGEARYRFASESQNFKLVSDVVGRDTNNGNIGKKPQQLDALQSVKAPIRHVRVTKPPRQRVA